MKKRWLSLLMVVAMLATLLPAGIIPASAAEDVKTIVCVGDSITAGSGSTGGNPYPTYLQNLLGSGYEVKNKGLSGRTMGDYSDGAQYTYSATDGTKYGNGSSTQADQATIAAADTVIIMLGTNDTKIAEFTEAYTSAYKAMIDKFVEWNSDVNFILATAPKSKVSGSNRWASADQLESVQSLVQTDILSYAKNDKTTGTVALIDIYNKMTGWETNTALWYDDVHPNYTGYEQLAKLFYEEFWDTTVHSFTVDGVEAENIKVDNLTGTISIAADETALKDKSATVTVAANSLVAENSSATVAEEEKAPLSLPLNSLPTTFTVTAPRDGLTKTYTVNAVDDKSDFEKTLIYNAEQLKGLQGQALTGDYKLMEDIDLGIINWNPITSLSGTFDGNGKTITMNTTVQTNNYGFIKTVNTDGVLQNLTIGGTVAGDATAKQSYIGVFAATNNGIVENCVNKAVMTDVGRGGQDGYAAGIVATNNGLLNGCANQADITGTGDFISGLVAKANAGSAIINSYNTGNITGDTNGVGGVVGNAQAGGSQVMNCYSTGTVKSTNTTGRVVAGIVADSNNAIPTVSITNCWNKGAIVAASGYEDICSRGNYTKNNTFKSTDNAADAIAKLNDNLLTGVTYNGVLYDLNSWTQVDGAPAFGETVAAMPQDENGVYHLLNKEHFDWWVKAVTADASISAVLETDITLTDTDNWTPIPNLTGTFDGGTHTISGLTINNATANNQGLFAQIAGGTVKNVKLKEVNITSSGAYVGGIAGLLNSGTISGCTVSGEFTLSKGNATYGGGIVGWAKGQADKIVIEDCRNEADLTIAGAANQDVQVGGVIGAVGEARKPVVVGSIVRNCVNIGKVTGSSDSATGTKKVGGVIGETYTSVVNCYNTGEVTGYGDVGGVVGIAYSSTTYVINLYNEGTVTGTVNTGGVVGRINTGANFYNGYTTVGNALGFNQASTAGNYYGVNEVSPTADFVRTLNNFVIEHKEDLAALKMSKWEKGADGYPVLTGEPAGADDVVDNTFLIETAAQLLAINNQSGEFTLANDITVTTADAASVNNDYLIENVQGNINGNGKIITLECNKFLSNYLYGTVHDLTIAGTINLPSIDKVAPFARYSYGSLYNCTFDGSVTAKTFASGMVIHTYGGTILSGCRTTSSSTVTASGTGYNYAAGMVSVTQDHDGQATVIRDCVNAATVTANSDYCGGIVGCVGNSDTVVVDHCTNIGTINGKNATGGVVAAGEGKATLIVTNCENNAAVSGGNYVGGIVGRTQADLTLYVVNNRSVGTISGTAGGLVQTVRGNVAVYLENNYSYNKQNLTAFSKSGAATVTAKDNYVWWNTAGTHADGYQQVTESTMKSTGFVLTLDSYVPSETVAVVLAANNITLKTWDAVADAMPVLGTDAIGSKGGIATDGDVLLIGSLLQLQYFRDQVETNAAQSARLTADITLTEDWVPLAIGYQGTFDGNGHTIFGFNQSGLSGNNVTGFFKQLDVSGVIQNLTLQGKIDCPNAVNVGAFVCQNNGRIYHCVNKVDIVDDAVTRDETGHLTSEGGKQAVGGFVGVNNNVIDSCVNKGIVTAFKDFAGGIAGQGNADSLIVNCRNEGEIAHTPGRDGDTGGSGSGGILGGAGNNVTAYAINCYNTGLVYDNNNHRGYIGGIVGDRGFSYNCYNAGVVWYKGSSSGAYGISGRQGAGTLEHCYSGYTTNTDKNNGTIMTMDEMQEASFASVMNDGVQAIAGNYAAIVVDKAVTLSNWAQGDEQLPAFGLTVQFYGKSNILLVSKSVLSITQLEEALASTKAPALGGYLFESWNTNTTDMNELWAQGVSGTLPLTAVYVTSPTEKKYAVTVENATAVAGDDTPVTADTPLSFDQRVIVSADSDQTVAYWELDGAKVGFNSNTYTFYVSGQNTIKAVFEDAGSYTPEVVLQQATYAVDSEGQSTLSVIAQTSIPNGYTVKSYGAYYTGSATVMKALAENADAVDASKYVQVVSSKTKAGEQYMTHLLNVGVGKTRYARAYAVVENTAGEQQILWSTAVYQFKTAADGVTITKGAIK